MSNIKFTINILILQKPDLPWNTIPEYGALYLFSVPFLFFGLWGIIKYLNEKQVQSKPVRKNSGKAVVKKIVTTDKYLFVAVILWFIIAIVSGLIINGVNVNRINVAFYPLIILCGIGIYNLIKRVRLLGIVILAVYLIAFAGFGSSYFGQHSKTLGQAFYDGFGEAMEYVKEMDNDIVYVTNWTQSDNSWWVSEPLALFHHQIDALYYQGKADGFSKTGKKLLPYKERYRYVQIGQLNINPGEKAVYIVRNEETSKFDKDSFDIINYAYYSAVVPKGSKAN